MSLCALVRSHLNGVTYMLIRQSRVIQSVLPLWYRTNQIICIELGSKVRSNIKTLGGNASLVVMGDDSCSRCCGFESRCCLLDGHDIFSH